MKKKMVIKVQIKCDKCRQKAWKLVSSAEGVESIAIEGEDKDRFVVIGEGVDFVRLTENLRKKLGYADIVSIGEVKKKKEESCKITDYYCNNIQWYPPYYPSSQMVMYYDEPCPTPNCNIM